MGKNLAIVPSAVQHASTVVTIRLCSKTIDLRNTVNVCDTHIDHSLQDLVQHCYQRRYARKLCPRSGDETSKGKKPH